MNVAILGAGGHGQVVLDILRCGGRYTPAAFLDADESLAGCDIAGIPVLGPVNQLPRLAQQKIHHAIVAIGDNRIRRTYARLAEDAGLELINAIHPSAIVSATARVGRNVVIAAGAVVCTDARIDDSVILNTSCVVEHECQIGESAHICPGAILAGRVRIGVGALVGMGARVLPCLSVGEDSTVGAGALVLSDVPSGATVVGVPARALAHSVRAAS